MAKAAKLQSTRDSIFESRDLLAFFPIRRGAGSLILVSVFSAMRA